MTISKLIFILGLFTLAACTTKDNSFSNAPGGTEGNHPISAGGAQTTETANPMMSATATPTPSQAH